MPSTYLTRNFTAGNRRTYTISCWIKRTGFSSDYQSVHVAGAGDDGIFFESDNTLHVWFNGGEKRTNKVFRDTNAWYHIVCTVDTTNSTAGDRIKIYINGERETSFQTDTNPTLNAENHYNDNGKINRIGNHTSSNYEFNGSMSHIHLIDGTAYDASVFGETDANGVWKIKTSPSVTYGTNGYFILKDGNSVTDQSGNTNNFTVGAGTLTKTEDCPSNVFATFNPLDGATSLGNSTFTFGNTRWNSESGSNKCWTRSTLGMTSGKYYFEMKVETPSNNCAIGISDRPAPNLIDELGAGAYDYSYQSQNGETINNGIAESHGNSYTTNDIVMCALDLDNNKLYFGKNGTWQNSGDPTSGSTGTGAAYNVTAPSLTNGGAYFFCGADLTGANNTILQANFGNGYFGTTAVSSAGTNASGIGIFEYDVPTGYTALSTKGLNL